MEPENQSLEDRIMYAESQMLEVGEIYNTSLTSVLHKLDKRQSKSCQPTKHTRLKDTCDKLKLEIIKAKSNHWETVLSFLEELSIMEEQHKYEMLELESELVKEQSDNRKIQSELLEQLRNCEDQLIQRSKLHKKASSLLKGKQAEIDQLNSKLVDTQAQEKLYIDTYIKQKE